MNTPSATLPQTAEQQQALSTLLGISRRLAEAAADGEWDKVAAMEPEQRKLLEDFFAGKDNITMTAEMVSGLSQVRIFTDMVLELAKKQRELLSGAADKLRTGKDAITAYAACSR